MLTIEYLQAELAHVYWMGGSPCAGKSSICAALAEAYGLQVYTCDDAYWRHEKMVDPENQPAFYKVSKLADDGLWLRPVEELLADELAVYREQFPMILDDLLAMPKTQPILAEGAALLPENVFPLLANPRRAVWVVPTAEFQLYHYGQRAWTKTVLQNTSDPQQAYSNWMQRDIRYARTVLDQARARNLAALVVNGQQTLPENIRWAESHFELGCVFADKQRLAG